MTTLNEVMGATMSFMPHGQCYLWTPGIVWLHVISDALVALSYFSIPVALGVFVRRRWNLQFSWVYLCFAVFILACGTTHVLEIWNVWHADYWVSGFAKAVTAAVSLPTAYFVWKLLPVALALPSAGDLKSANSALSAEIVSRKKVEAGMQELTAQLERRVSERTAELLAANAELKRQIAERDEAREALKLSIKEGYDLRAALDEHAIVAITDPQGRITYVNDRFCAISRYSRDELIGQDHRIINSGHHSPEFIRDLWATIGRGAVWHGEIKNKAKDGTTYWVDTTLVPFLDEKGKPRQYVAIRADITERKRAERRLRESEELFAKSFRLSPDYVVIVRLRDRTVLEANDALCELWDRSREDLVGASAPDFVSWVDPQAREAFMKTMSERGECLDQDAWLQMADGRKIEFGISSRVITFKGEECVLSVMRDITARKRIEVAAAQLAAIVESSDDAIIGKDLNAVVTSWNAGAEQIFDYTAEEMIGKPILRLIPPERQDDETTILQRILRGETVRPFDTVRLRKDGSRVDVAVSVSAIRGPEGVIVGAAKVAREITGRKRAEEQIRRLNAELEQRVVDRTRQLETANKELEAFSYSVSHDLRAPLRAVDGFSQVVLEDFGTQLPPEGRRQLQIIRNGAQRMSVLIDDLLTFSRLSREPVKTQMIDTEQMVRTAFDELRGQQPQAQVTFDLRALPPTRGDPALLRQVWLNLLGNALKYSRKQAAPVIEVGTVDQPGEVTFYVRDNGVGFDMRYVDKLFGVFQRLHRVEEYEGTGVGLAIVQRIVHRHGGRVWVEAKVNQGATFYFTLQGEPGP